MHFAYMDVGEGHLQDAVTSLITSYNSYSSVCVQCWYEFECEIALHIFSIVVR